MVGQRSRTRQAARHDSGAGGGTQAPLDPLLEAWTSDGVLVALSLSTWGALPPPLVVKLMKNDVTAALARLGGVDMSLRSPAEQVVQSYAIPLTAFVAADPAFDPALLDGIVLRMTRTTPGGLAVAKLALAP